MSVIPKIPAKEMCERAVAYVKGLYEPKQGDRPPLRLSFEDSFVMRPVCDDLATAYLVDAGDAFRYVQNRHLREAGISADELHRTAVKNLADLCHRQLQIREHSKIYAFLMGGHFEASCLLIDDLFERVLQPHIPNGYVAAAPARDMFAVCSRDSAEGIRELEELIQRIWPKGDHLVTDKLLVRDAQKWRSINAQDVAHAYGQKQ